MVSLLIASLLTQSIDQDIVYATVNKLDLKLDAYRPPQPMGKVFIAIHGGGFTGGNKGQNTGQLCRFLSSRGFTCFDINYRLQNDTGGTKQDAIKAAVDDSILAYNWVLKNASKYGGDPNKISIGGASAGAITSLYAAYSRRISVKSVVDLWGGMYGKETDMKKGDPALLIVHGSNDKTVPFTLAIALENRAKAVGIKYRFLKTSGGHSPAMNTSINDYTILEHVDSFLRETM